MRYARLAHETAFPALKSIERENLLAGWRFTLKTMTTYPVTCRHVLLQVHGNFYGTSVAAVAEVSRRGQV